MNGKILIVDDEKPIADILKYNLEEEGYQVLVAYDGEHAPGFQEWWILFCLILCFLLLMDSGEKMSKRMSDFMLTPKR